MSAVDSAPVGVLVGMLLGLALLVACIEELRGSRLAPATPSFRANVAAQYNPPAWAKARLAIEHAEKGEAPPKYGDALFKKPGDDDDQDTGSYGRFGGPSSVVPFRLWLQWCEGHPPAPPTPQVRIRTGTRTMRRAPSSAPTSSRGCMA